MWLVVLVVVMKISLCVIGLWLLVVWCWVCWFLNKVVWFGWNVVGCCRVRLRMFMIFCLWKLLVLLLMFVFLRMVIGILWWIMLIFIFCIIWVWVSLWWLVISSRCVRFDIWYWQFQQVWIVFVKQQFMLCKVCSGKLYMVLLCYLWCRWLMVFFSICLLKLIYFMLKVWVMV